MTAHAKAQHSGIAGDRPTPETRSRASRMLSAAGPFNADHFALLMEMCLGLLLGLAVGRGALRRSIRLLCLSAAVLLWTALVLSVSRGGIFAAAGQIVFLALMWGVTTSRRLKHDGYASLGSGE